MIYELPNCVEINGKEWEIHTDFRCILDIFEVLNDVDLTDQERGFLALGFFYPDISEMTEEDYPEAIKRLFWFINGGKLEKKKDNRPKLMDWEQDYPLIIPAINKTIGHEVRNDKHLHWWTFLGAYMEIGECTFSQVIRVRQKKATGKRLDKADAEWYSKNRDICDLETKYSQAETDILKAWGGEIT